MKTWLSLCAIALPPLLAAAPADASYTYNLQGEYGSASFILDQLYDGHAAISLPYPGAGAGQTQSCSVQDCTGVTLSDDGQYVFIILSAPAGGTGFIFDDVGFAGTCIRNAVVNDPVWGGQRGTLTITEDGQAAVPEAGAWAMMLAGFAAIGAALRRRRRLVQPETCKISTALS